VAATFKPPATLRRYDVCVLGGGLGGAAAAALLSRRGFRVLLVDDGARAPRADGGWLLPIEPTVQPWLRHLPAAEALLAEAGLTSDATRAQEHLSPDLQLLLPRHRLELHREPAGLQAELRREWPTEAARLVAGLQSLQADADAGGQFLAGRPPLPPGGFFQGFALRKALRAAERTAGAAARPPLQPLEGHPLAAALAALPWLLGHLDGPPSPLATARLVGVALRGLARTAVGAASLEDALRRKVTEARGELLGSAAEPARPESIGLEGGRLATLRLAGAGDGYAARAFLLAGPVDGLLRLVAEPPASRAVKALARLRAGRRLASLHRVVRAEALPPGLGTAALRLGADAAPGQAVLLEVLPARPDQRKGAPPAAEGLRLVSAWTVADDGQAGADQAEARLEAALLEALPFPAGHLIHAAGLHLAPHLYVHDVPAAGVGGLPVQGPWKNLVLCGRQVIPGLGLEGELSAAQQAAERTTSLLGVKNKPR
jgi:phytoene dehydrogenase-like protein